MRLIITGPPASGKGTLAPYIAEEYNILHISTGQMFREEIKKGTPMGLKIKDILDKGLLVSDELTDEMVRKRLSEDDVINGFLLDGFPRNIIQAKYLDELLKEKGLKLDYVIALDVDEDIILKRISGRRVCPSCGKNYNIYFSKPQVEGKCDIDGATLIKRTDDNIETAQKRIEIYRNETEPIIKYYEEKGNLIKVEGSKKTSEVFMEIKQQVKNKWLF